MIFIASYFVLFMIGVGHGNPMPEPNPDMNLILQVRQVVHRRYCNKDHDKEGPHGHPATEAPVDVEALEKEKEELDNAISAAEDELEDTQAELDGLEDAVAEEEADIAAVDDIASDLGSLFDFRRKRRSVSEQVEEVLGGLGGLFSDSLRSRRDISSSDSLTITYCPVANGEITDTGYNLYLKALTDISAALNPFNKDLAVCIKDVLTGLKAKGITLTVEEKMQLKMEADMAKMKADDVKAEKEVALVEKKAEVAVAQAKVEALEETIAEKKEEAAKIEEEIEKAEENEPEATDSPFTTELTTLTTKDISTTAAKLLPTTPPNDE